MDSALISTYNSIVNESEALLSERLQITIWLYTQVHNKFV